MNDGNFMRPELKNHTRQYDTYLEVLGRVIKNRSPRYRFFNWVHFKFQRESRLNAWLLAHGQRTNYQPLFFLGCGFMMLGHLAFYVNYRINVVEPKWVENYGQDVPHWKKAKLMAYVQYARAKYIHFFRYRIFYFI